MCDLYHFMFTPPTLAVMWCMEQDSNDDTSNVAGGDKDTEMSSDDTLTEDMEVKDSLTALTEALLRGAVVGEV